MPRNAAASAHRVTVIRGHCLLQLDGSFPRVDDRHLNPGIRRKKRRLISRTESPSAENSLQRESTRLDYGGLEPFNVQAFESQWFLILITMGGSQSEIQG